MAADITDAVKGLYNDVHERHGDGYAPAEVEPYDPVESGELARIKHERADWQLLHAERPNITEAATAYQQAIDETREAMQELKEASQEAASRLPDRMTEERNLSDDLRLVYDDPDYTNNQRRNPCRLFRALGPVLVDETDQDIAEYLAEEDGSEALVQDWDQKYDDWEDDLATAAEEAGVTDALEDAYAQGEAVTHAAAELLDELEKDLGGSSGPLDRLLGR